MATLQQKVQISLGSAVLFSIINLPQTYKLTDSLLPCKLIEKNCPTHMGLFLHTVVFFLITLLTMGRVDLNTLKNALYGTLIFFFLSSPTIYSLTGNSCPKIGGVLLHSVLYFVALVGVMYLP